MPDRPSGLVDTGALVAYLNRKDPWHSRCVEAIASARLPLATSAAVLTEVFHFLVRSHDVSVIWRFLRSGIVIVLPIEDSDLPDLEALMTRYRDRPMDFADATLVHLARREGLTTVFTIDHNDFETYRIEERRHFRIVPSR